MIISLGLNKSRTKLFKKKGYLPGDKRLWPISSRIIECDKPQGTFYNGPTSVVTITLKVIGAFLQDLRVC